jgi:hypothetical protein
LILDIDCIPLSSYAIEYSFQQAEKNILIGNIQRANHINNNAHLYVSPSSMCFSKDLYFSLDCPSFASTHKGDIGEEFTYRAENNIEYYYPSHFEQQPTNKKGIIQNAWELNEALPTYGIGTTYSLNDIDMYYHLFQSRYGTHNQLFYNRCNKLLNDNR